MRSQGTQIEDLQRGAGGYHDQVQRAEEGGDSFE